MFSHPLGAETIARTSKAISGYYAKQFHHACNNNISRQNGEMRIRPIFHRFEGVVHRLGSLDVGLGSLVSFSDPTDPVDAIAANPIPGSIDCFSGIPMN